MAGIDGDEAAFRRKRRRKHEEKGAVAYFHSRMARLHMASAVGLLLMGFVGTQYYGLQRAGQAYAGISLGMPKIALQEIRGVPEGGNAAGDDWLYSSGPAQVLARFNNGSISEVRCVVSDQSMVGCPSVLGVGSGASQAEVFAAFGVPDSKVTAGAEQVLVYRGMGYSFRLRDGAVTGVILQQPQGGFSLLRTLGYRLIP